MLKTPQNGRAWDCTKEEESNIVAIKIMLAIQQQQKKIIIKIKSDVSFILIAIIAPLSSNFILPTLLPASNIDARFPIYYSFVC